MVSRSCFFFRRLFSSLAPLSWLPAALLLLPLAGCGWANLGGHQSTLDVAGPVAESQRSVFLVTVWVTLFIFVVVGAVLAYAMIKFRARGRLRAADALPGQDHGNPWIEVGLILASVGLLAIIAVPTMRAIWYTYDVPEAERKDALEVVATGYQWWFKFEYPTEKIALPAGGEGPLVTGNELVVPAGRAVRVQLRTTDVIHSFWVPKLAGKVDMIPNRPNFLWFKATAPGYFYGQCAEFCGESHAIMRFRVIALAPADYAAWLATQKLPARATSGTPRELAQIVPLQPADPAADRGGIRAASPAFEADPLAGWKRQQELPAQEDADLIARGRALFQTKTCIGCHVVRGHEGVGIAGPDLTHVGSRTTIAAGVLANTPERMFQWVRDPAVFKPGNKMVHGGYIEPKTGRRLVTLDAQEITALVAYLQHLK
ncbi:MAG: cytochrome c oxidase subunit II [Opitutae bacterium]|nr:cytochrome c oxidase subunit II [Opitutae bacterium]